MGIEVEALLPEWEKPARIDRRYCISFMCKEDYKRMETNAFELF